MPTQIDAIPCTALPEIIAVAAFANKYEMGDWREWALTFISRRILDQTEISLVAAGKLIKATRRNQLMNLGVQDLADLHGLYHRLDGPDAVKNRDLIMTTWSGRVATNQLPVSGALEAAAACGDQDSLAHLYCLQLRRMKAHARLLEPAPFPSDDIAPIHFQRMFAGYASLSLAWDRLREQAPPFPFHPESCASEREHTVQCVPRYETWWKDAIHAAEAKWPDITKMAARVSAVLRYLRNVWGMGDDGTKWNCFGDFFESPNGLGEVAKNFYLTAHFFPEKKSRVSSEDTGLVTF